jgi:hypothetical protein
VHIRQLDTQWQRQQRDSRGKLPREVGCVGLRELWAQRPDPQAPSFKHEASQSQPNERLHGRRRWSDQAALQRRFARCVKTAAIVAWLPVTGLLGPIRRLLLLWPLGLGQSRLQVLNPGLRGSVAGVVDHVLDLAALTAHGYAIDTAI